MSVDQTTGSIYIVFYDRRNTTGDNTDVYMARSTDGGNNFSNVQISASSFLPNSSTFFGDYTNITRCSRARKTDMDKIAKQFTEYLDCNYRLPGFGFYKRRE